MRMPSNRSEPIYRIRRPARTLAISGLALLALSGCKTTDEINAPIVDMPNPTYQQREAYVADLNECSQYADEVQTGKKVGMGAATGAAIGGAVGAIFGGGKGAAQGAGSGAVVGGAQGGLQGADERSRVIKSCLRGRGYRVLN
jgi:outer membrane lipoprotein SlyB